MDFNPVNDDHAVATVSFGVFTSEFIDADRIQKLISKHNLIRTELPAVTVLEDGPPGVEFAYRRPDGTASWALRCGNANEIIVECNRYTRWKKVWSTAQSLLDHAMECCLLVGEIQFVNPTLRVVDRFRAVVENPQIASLLKRDRFLAEAIFDVGPIFHSNVGWYVEIDRNQVLNTLNLSGRKENVFKQSVFDVVPTLFVTLDQIQQYRSSFSYDINAISSSNFLEVVMNRLHDDNKILLQRVLTSEMQEKIGLRGGK